MNDVLGDVADRGGILNDVQKELGGKRGILYYFKLLLVFAAIGGFGVYFGDMLFGKNSLEVLMNLYEKKDYLEKEVLRLKEENAALQKEYFELIQLDPDKQ